MAFGNTSICMNLNFYLAYIQHNTANTENMLIMNARKPVITKLVEPTGRPLILYNSFYLYMIYIIIV